MGPRSRHTRARHADAVRDLEVRLAPLAWQTVLLVENDEPLRDAAVPLLELAGADVVACAGAADALLALQDVVPDAVLTDLELPDDGGTRLARELRAQPDLAGVRVVAMAPPGHPTERALFDAVLEKPSAYPQVVDVLRRLALPDHDEHAPLPLEPGDRLFVAIDGDAIGLVQLVRDEDFVAHVDGGPLALPRHAVAARHGRKVLLDLSRVERDLSTRSTKLREPSS